MTNWLFITLGCLLAIELVALLAARVVNKRKWRKQQAELIAQAEMAFTEACNLENTDAAKAFELYCRSAGLANEAKAYDLEHGAVFGAARTAHAAADPIAGRRYQVVAREIAMYSRRVPQKD